MIRSEDDEVGDDEVSKIIIVAQTPPAFLRKKGKGVEIEKGESPRVRYDKAQARVIEDGLLHFESVSACCSCSGLPLSAGFVTHMADDTL